MRLGAFRLPWKSLSPLSRLSRFLSIETVCLSDDELCTTKTKVTFYDLFVVPKIRLPRGIDYSFEFKFENPNTSNAVWLPWQKIFKL